MLDDFDLAILNQVQTDNQQTHEAIGRKVHLSPSSVRRRLKALRERKVIRADVSIVDPSPSWITVIVTLRFEEESLEARAAFEARMRAASEVSQCYSVSGETDFVLVVHAPDLESYEAWGKEALMADPAVPRYDSHVVWSRVKCTTALPLGGPLRATR